MPTRSMEVAVVFFLLLSLLTACASPSGGLSPPGEPPAGQHPWAAALRALDPSGASDPAQDITAVYLRQTEEVLQVRVDLLDFQSAKELSLDITLADAPAPGSPPLSIHIPSSDSPFLTSLDPLLATVIVDVPLSAIPSRPQVDVSTREEQVAGLRLDGPVPAGTASLLLTFYDTFAARFPAEALRRWDGAHTGPRGDRHGLKHLLEAAEAYGLPIFLLDLKTAENLSVLDAMGVLPQIRRMQDRGLLILPQNSSNEILFGLQRSLYWFDPSPTPQSDSLYRFQLTSDSNHLRRWLEFPRGMRTSIPIAMETGSGQPTPDGPSLEVRRALLETALNTDEKDLLVLGGSLPEGTWGSPDRAGPTLAYFASRPYIQILTSEDLMNFPTERGKPEVRSLSLDGLDQLETHYKNLTEPVLRFVANWEGSPLSSCETDLDKDHQPECVLANRAYLAILDPQGARLTYLFAVGRVGREASPTGSWPERGGNPPNIQLIGPSWQVAVGLSNPSRWDLSAWEAADPGAYPGAFADADDPFKPYEPAIDANSVVFTSMDGTRIKTFTLDENGLQIEYHMREPVRTQIPLLVEPVTRLTPGWAQMYVQKKTPEGIAWGLANGPMVRVQVQDAAPGLPEGRVTLRAFNESLSLLAGPEDPDFDYPGGHTVPFPMAIAEAEMQAGYFLRLERLP